VPSCLIEPTVFDGGEVFSGQTVRCTFPVKNTGQSELKIAVRPSCGCTVAQFDEVIAPGGEGKIDVTWTLTATRDGRSKKSISVTTNDPENPLIKLTVQATVTATIRAMSGTEDPIQLRNGEPTIHEIMVETRGAPPLEISGASVNASYATVAVHPPEVRGDKTNVQKLTLTIDSSAPQGRNELTVLLAADSSRHVFGELKVVCEKGITVSKDRIVLRSPKADSPPATPVTLTLSKREGNFQITGVETGDLEMVVDVNPVQEGQEYRLGLTARAESSRRGNLRIYTDDPDQPVIDVALFVVPR